MINWLSNKIYYYLAYKRYGNINVPGDRLRLEIIDDNLKYIIATTNDGYDLFIGYPDEWLFNCSAKSARKIAKFIIWDWWIKSTWFGLRRYIWYWALSKRCKLYVPR